MKLWFASAMMMRPLVNTYSKDNISLNCLAKADWYETSPISAMTEPIL